MRKLIWMLTFFGITAVMPVSGQPAGVVPLPPTADQAYLLTYILKDEQPDRVHKSRVFCTAGTAQRLTDRSRSLGSSTLPDAVDECPTVLLRQARDGTLLGLYRDLLVELSGQADGHEQLPAAIAGVVMRGGNQVMLGNQRAAVITAALALDAGFTVAYRKGERVNATMPGLAALRPIADRCLKQQERDLSLCYAAGYTLGARAVSGQPVTAM